MSTIIEEPFAPRRRRLVVDYRRKLSRVSFFGCRLKRSLVHKLAEASLDNLCMIVLLVSLLVTTLLLPWIVM
jgi:hypothetical protein